MYRCPECGTEYTVVPEACTVCGHETEASEHIDLFAAAQEQERQAAENRRERLAEYRRRQEEKAAAAENAGDAAASRPAGNKAGNKAGNGAENGAVFSELETASASGKQPVRPASADSAGRSTPHAGMKLAVIGAAAAIALVGGVYALLHRKPVGFRKSTVGTFYLKGTALWFQNGKTAETVCLNKAVFSDLDERQRYLDGDFAGRLDSLLYVSPDGSEFYYPQTVSFTKRECRLMHCTAKHPERSEEVATLRLHESDYNFRKESLSLRSVEEADETYYQMNPPYLVSGDAIYYRNTEGAFCRTQNGHKEVLAPYVERFWTVPGQTEVYYIAIRDFEQYQEKNAAWEAEYQKYLADEGMTSGGSESAFRPDYQCMLPYVQVQVIDERMEACTNADDYALFRTVPGENPELLADRIVDWCPLRADCPQHLYYTAFNDGDDDSTVLSCYDFQQGTASELFSAGTDSLISLLGYYPTGECYFSLVGCSQERIEERFAEITGYRAATDEKQSERSTYTYLFSPDSASIYYMDAARDPHVLSAGTGGNLYHMQNTALCYDKPYICFSSFTEPGGASNNLFFRGQRILLTFSGERNTQPEYFHFSADGTLLFAGYSYYIQGMSDSDAPYPAKVLCGTLDGTDLVELSVISEAKDNAKVFALAQENGPAEVLRIVDRDMYSGDEKIAEGMQHSVCMQQDEYCQISFIADEISGPNDSAMISMNKAYRGTLMRRCNGRTEEIAGNVTGFIPVDSEQYMVICGEKGKNGVLNYCRCGDVWYQADEGVSALIGVRELQGKRASGRE